MSFDYIWGNRLLMTGGLISLFITIGVREVWTNVYIVMHIMCNASTLRHFSDNGFALILNSSSKRFPIFGNSYLLTEPAHGTSTAIEDSDNFVSSQFYQ